MKLYSYNLELLAYLEDVIVTVDSVLGNISTLSFTFPKYTYDRIEGDMIEDSRYKYIVNEAVIEYNGEHYLIKEAIPLREGNYVAKEVVCKSLAVEWSGTKIDGHWGYSPMIDHFEFPHNEPATLEMALNDLIARCMPGWRIGVLPETEKRRTFDFEWSTPMQIITDLAKVYDYTPRFRSAIINGELFKYIDILDNEYGEIKGYYRHDSTLDNIRIPINTDAITTRLYLFGYDNLTINDLPDETKIINDIEYPVHEKGQSYIQNFDYYLAQGYTYEDCLSKFVKVDYESDDLYVDAEDLYQFGKNRIEQIGVPQMAYAISIKDIEFNGKPEIELGHNIRVVDEELGIDMTCRVSKIGYSSDDKENKSIEITNYTTYMTEFDLLTDLMVKHENLSQGAIKKYSKFAGSLVFSDNTGLTVQAPVEGQMGRASTDSLEGKLVRDVVKIGTYEKDKYGIQILDGQIQLDREDGLTRIRIDNSDGIIIYNNHEADGFTDEHRVFYVDNMGNLVAEKITVRNGIFYLKDGQEIEAVIGGINGSLSDIVGDIGGINGSLTEIEKEQIRLDEITKAENIIATVTDSSKYVNDLLEKANSATVDATINSVKSELQGKIDSVDGKVGEAVLEIDKTKESLTLKANKTDVYTKSEADTALSGKADQADLAGVIERVTSTETELTVQAGQIASKVEEKTYEVAIGSINESLTGKADNSTVNGIIERVTTAESSIVQNAEAIATKVSNTTYQQDKENLESRVTTAESNITQNANGISLKANKTDVYTKGETDGKVETVAEKVTAVESSLEIQAELIASKVSSVDYEKDMEGVGSRLTTAESNITQNATQIQQKVSNTTYQQDKNGIIERLSSAESNITQQADQIALKASKTDVYTKDEVNNKVDEIEIGGINLLKNSNFINGKVGWSGGVVDTVLKKGDSNSILLSKSNSSGDDWTATIQKFYDSPNNGDQFVVSCWYYVKDRSKFTRGFTLEVKGSINNVGGTEISLGGLSVSKDDLIIGKWIRLSTTIKTNRGDLLSISIHPYIYNNGEIWLTEIQAEKGNKLTDWSPNPIDLINRIESTEAQIKVNADSITQTVKKTDYTGESVVSMINQTADSIKISAKHLDISGAVTFSSFDKTTQDKINTIESTASSASSTASTAKSTADTAKSTADSAKTTATTANTNASTALNTANTAKSTADTAKTTADGAKSVADTANGKIATWCHTSNTTLIDGGKIYTGSITAVQIASNAITADKISAGSITTDKLNIGDFTNYAQLNDNTASKYGFTKQTTEASGTWLKRTSAMSRDIPISNLYTCNGGESLRVKFDISTTLKGNTTSNGTDSSYCGTTIMIFAYDGSGASIAWLSSNRHSNTTVNNSSAVVKLPVNARKFRVYVQTDSYGNWSGELKVRNISVTKMTDAELIVNGAITANMITSGTFKGANFEAGGSGTAGLILAKDASNNTTFSASKNGVFAKNITFVDAINNDGTHRTTASTVLTSEGYRYSREESTSSYTSVELLKFTGTTYEVKSELSRTDGTKSLSQIKITPSGIQFANSDATRTLQLFGTHIAIGSSFNSDALHMGRGSGDCYLRNSKTDAYIQLKDNGYLDYTGAVELNRLGIKDSRGSNPAPNSWSAYQAHFDFKTVSDLGMYSADATWCNVLTTKGWNGDNVAHPVSQLAFNGSAIYYHCGNGSNAWGTWRRIPMLEHANGYWGFGCGANNFATWLRSPSDGFLPYRSGGSSSLGSSSWMWNSLYVKNIHVDGGGGTNALYLQGNGDGINYGSNNMFTKCWWGWGFQDHTNSTNAVIDTRSGRFIGKSAYWHNSSKSLKSDVKAIVSDSEPTVARMYEYDTIDSTVTMEMIEDFLDTINIKTYISDYNQEGVTQEEHDNSKAHIKQLGYIADEFSEHPLFPYIGEIIGEYHAINTTALISSIIAGYQNEKRKRLALEDKVLTLEEKIKLIEEKIMGM